MRQVARTLKGFAELLRRPRGRGVVGDGDMHDTAPLVREDHRHEQELARGRWYDDHSP
jgi:hypothetical protein